MDIKKLFKDILFFGSLYYTAITTVLIVIASLLSESEATLIDTKRFLLTLLFSFIMGIGSAVLRADAINHAAARATHAACYILGFLLFIALGGANFSASVIGTLVFAIVYIAVTLIIKLFSISGKSKGKSANENKRPQAHKSNKKEKNTYTNQFLK
jgi:hypothetical protein